MGCLPQYTASRLLVQLCHEAVKKHNFPPTFFNYKCGYLEFRLGKWLGFCSIGDCELKSGIVVLQSIPGGGGGPHSPIEMSLLLFVQDDKNPAGQHLFPFGPHSIGNRSSSSSPLQRLREAGKGIKETKCRKRELQRKLPSLRCSLKNDHYRRTKSCSL